MKKEFVFFLTLLISILSGLLIAWIDSRPNWDDSGVTAGLIVIASGLFSFFYQSRPIVWALAVSCWIPAHAIFYYGDFKLLPILLIGLAGSYAGLFLGRFKTKVK